MSLWLFQKTILEQYVPKHLDRVIYGQLSESENSGLRHLAENGRVQSVPRTIAS